MIKFYWRLKVDQVKERPLIWTISSFISKPCLVNLVFMFDPAVRVYSVYTVVRVPSFFVLRQFHVTTFGISKLNVTIFCLILCGLHIGVCVWLDLRMIGQYLSYLLMDHLIWWHTDSVPRFVLVSFLIYQFVNMWLCRCPASLSEIPLWWVRWESNNDLSGTAFIILFPQSSLTVSLSILFSCIQVKPLIWVEAQVERHSRSRIEMVLKARSQFKDRR